MHRASLRLCAALGCLVSFSSNLSAQPPSAGPGRIEQSQQQPIRLTPVSPQAQAAQPSSQQQGNGQPAANQPPIIGPQGQSPRVATGGPAAGAPVGELGRPQAVPQQGGPQQPAQAGQQAPGPRQLNQQEQNYVLAVLTAWSNSSDQIKTFRCPFEQQKFNAAFGPGPNVPLYKNDGELSYQQPDKGSFQIKTVRVFKMQDPVPGQDPSAPRTGDWVEDPNATGEHWVCDGKSVYQYRHDQKQLVEMPIPPEMQGQAIVDGPLPFLFGAKPNKVLARYWIEPMLQFDRENPQQIFLRAWPKLQAQASDFRAVDVILDRKLMLPTAMQVHLPNGDRDMYLFYLDQAGVNSPLDRLQGLFGAPSTPFGWDRIREPLPQMPPQAAPRQAQGQGNPQQ